MPPVLKRMATGSSFCVGQLCRLTAVFSVSQHWNKSWFHLEIFYPSLWSVCFHIVLRHAQMRPETGWLTLGETKMQMRNSGTAKLKNDSNLDILRLRVMVH